MPSRKSSFRSVNMIAVARRAGVSTATVGRVVHQRGYVSEAARQRVEQAIQQTGFRLNLVAQSLRCQRSKTIGHLINSLIPNPFFAGVEAGVEEAASEKGYNVLIWNFMADPQRERAGVEAFIRRQIDAIIFTTPFDIHNVQLAQQAGIEIVQVERPTSLPSHCVLVDNYVGAVAAMRHLIDLGHRRIGFIGNTCPDELSGQKINNNVDRQRYQGYLDELAFHGIQPEAAWSCLNANPYSLVDGERAALSLLQMQPAVTAILSSCDILAAGALQALLDASVDDCSCPIDRGRESCCPPGDPRPGDRNGGRCSLFLSAGNRQHPAGGTAIHRPGALIFYSDRVLPMT
jgi:DNA-binding LacI/PurR family transcriptional regulator